MIATSIAQILYIKGIILENIATDLLVLIKNVILVDISIVG